MMRLKNIRTDNIQQHYKNINCPKTRQRLPEMLQIFPENKSRKQTADHQEKQPVKEHLKTQILKHVAPVIQLFGSIHFKKIGKALRVVNEYGNQSRSNGIPPEKRCCQRFRF